ncbi:unnamed protein product [Closterium sp. NIES-54]
MVFPLAKKSEVTSTLIRWLLATEGTRGRRVSCLHSDRGGNFRSGVLRGFYGEQGISHSWTLAESPQHNGVAERRIGLVMDIACTSMIHAPVCLAARGFTDQSLDRVPWCWVGLSCLGLPCACPRHLCRQALGSRHPLCLPWFPDSLDYAFYHPPLHQFLDSRDVRFDEPVTYYTWYPCRGLPVPPPLLFLAPSPPPAPAPPVPPPPPGPAPSGVSHVTPLTSVTHQVASPSSQSSSQSSQQPWTLSRQVAVDSGGVGAGGADTGGGRSGGACSRGAGARGASSGGAGAGGAGTGGASSEGAGAGGSRAGGAGTGGASSGGARAGGTGAGGTGTGGASSKGPGAGGTDTSGATLWRH